MKLPLLDFASNIFKNVNLEKVLVIAVQHLLETNYCLFEYLFKLGLKPENVFLLGKCYSTNKYVMDLFKKKGVNIQEGSRVFSSHLAYDLQFTRQVKILLKKIQNKVRLEDYEKVILVDDGGVLVEQGNIIIKKTNNVVAVEQTSSGFNKLKHNKLRFPVINVARSKAKLIYESPFIAEAVLNKLLLKIKKINFKIEKVLIIGAGAIGKEIFNRLKNRYIVHIYDNQKHISDFGKISLSKILSEFDLIIGATGNTSINHKMYRYFKKKVVLVSASSSDREFSAVNLRVNLPETSNCHQDLYLKNITLINCGFPINFDGTKKSVPAKKIQLTRALIFAAICLAKQSKYKKKFVNLKPEVQKIIIEQFHTLTIV